MSFDLGVSEITDELNEEPSWKTWESEENDPIPGIEDDDLACVCAARAGEKGARAELAKRFTGLIISVVRKHNHDWLREEDLVQEGMAGLFVALERFDTSRGNKFGTYAHWWIRDYVQRAQELHRGPVRIPHSAYRTMCAAAAAGDNSAFPMEFSLSADEDGDYTTLEKNYSDNNSTESVDHLVHTQSMACLLQGIMNELPERQKDILAHRFGMGNFDECTLDDMANEYQVTRERVRQIQEAGIKALRRALEKRGINSEAALS